LTVLLCRVQGRWGRGAQQGEREGSISGAKRRTHAACAAVQWVACLGAYGCRTGAAASVWRRTGAGMRGGTTAGALRLGWQKTIEAAVPGIAEPAAASGRWHCWHGCAWRALRWVLMQPSHEAGGDCKQECADNGQRLSCPGLACFVLCCAVLCCPGLPRPVPSCPARYLLPAVVALRVRHALPRVAGAFLPGRSPGLPSWPQPRRG
jgi:hypothetical protein